MKENTVNRNLTVSKNFVPTPQNTSCTGGTVTDISMLGPEENDGSVSYVLTINELRSCSGFEDLTKEQAEEIIQALTQLSALCYQAVFK